MDVQSSGTDYRQLKEWYLARLRQSALNRAVSLTPATLIQADREFVEKLISHSAGGMSSNQESAARHRKEDLIVAMLLGMAFALGTWCVMQFAPNVQQKLLPVILLCIVLIVLTHYLFKTLMLRRLARAQSIGNWALSQANTNRVQKVDGGLAGVESLIIELAEFVLRANTREFAIADYAGDLICSIDQTGEITAVNSASLRLWGYLPEEIVGRSFLMLVEDGDREATGMLLEGLRSRSSEGIFDMRMTCKDGSSIDMQWCGEFTTAGNLIFMVGADVTAQKELQRMRDEYVSMVSHDLRAPLATISAQLTLLTDGVLGDLPERAHKMIKQTEDRTLKLIDLANKVLDAEKMKSGKLCVVLDVTELAPILTEAVESLHPLADRKHIQLRMKECCQTPVMADKSWLMQVFVNLLTNAIKASPEKGTVTIDTSVDADQVQVSIHDDGPGIPPEAREKVFERFSQLARTKTDVGSGLGLAICKGIIEKHNGAIGLHSEAGKGTTFWIKLPIGNAASSLQGVAEHAT